jgi:hypothetical protein
MSGWVGLCSIEKSCTREEEEEEEEEEVGFVVSPVEAEKNGGNEKEAATTQAVQVAVNIRPLIAMERVQGCKDCITIVPGEPQVSTSSLCFCFCMNFHSFLVYGCGLFSMPFATSFFWR